MNTNSKMISKMLLSLGFVLAMVGGFVLGTLHVSGKPLEIQKFSLEDFREISLINLTAIKGDSLQVKISGPARILWNEDMVEKDGIYEIPLGQIETENDRQFRSFAYVGNAKTNNFYPADSYPARGTEHQYRRFFESKEDALQAGFNASKLVK